MKSKRVAIYARVSTLDKGQDTEVQLRDLRAYAKARGWIIADEYIDEGQSGAKVRRPELVRLMNDVRKRKVDLILCWRLDRLGRSLKHLILTLDELHLLLPASLHPPLADRPIYKPAKMPNLKFPSRTVFPDLHRTLPYHPTAPFCLGGRLFRG
jgi:hypothetical protein